MSTHLVLASGLGTLWEATGTGRGTAEQEDVGSALPRWARPRGRCSRCRKYEATLRRQAGGTARSAGEASRLSSPEPTRFLRCHGQSPGQLRGRQQVSEGKVACRKATVWIHRDGCESRFIMNFR